MSGKESEDVLSIASLGRPFRLGMLYDCRSDKLISGITLWSKETLQKGTVQKLETADYEIIASDSIDDKASALDVNVGLKLSFLGGLIDISGSGKYLDNRKSSNHQERVTLKYKCTTRSEEMIMEQLGKGKIEHPEVFDHGTATHVVTGITYGGQAFFVFDREFSLDSADREVHGFLKVMIKKIPKLGLDGEGNLDLSENEKKNIHKFSCRYFGDFLPKENPSSFEESVRLYKDIPKLIGKEGENAVPIMVRLYPLALLDSRACRLVREISSHLVRETEKVLEDLHEFEVKCNDLIKSHAVQNFPKMQAEIQMFKSLIITYKLGFQKELSLLLPTIRGGGKEESELANLLRKKESSPFGHNALTTWIQEKERTVKILSEYTSSLSKVKFASEPGDLQAMVMSPDNTHILCFSILMPISNPHLTQMARYNKKEQYASDVDDAEEQNLIPLKNLDDERSMMEKARAFKDFFEANKDNSETAFIVAEESADSNEFQAKVKYYKNGRLIQEDFDIPSAPDRIDVEDKETRHDSIFVKWDKPSYGMSNISKYKIVCEKINESYKIITCYTDSSTNHSCITGLEPNCEYQVKVQSLCEPGNSLPSKSSEAIKTKPTSPPGKPEIWQISSTTAGLKWLKPSVIGSQCTIIKYVVKEQQEGSDWYEKDLAAFSDHSVTFPVNINITYRFKVYCDCGPAGNSLDSEVSDDFVVKIDPKDYLKSRLCGESRLVQDGKLCIYQPELRRTAQDTKNNLEKFEFGTEKNTIPEKVIMVVGATGSGKTTLINGIINYIFAVDWKDSFRFKLITEPDSQNQANSQTIKITSYTIHHQEGFRVPYTLTIIDTPGFGDVNGIERDREITNQIRTFFTAGGMGGIDRLDAVGFVAQSSLPRLTPTQRYIFDQILSLFGRDIAENIFLLLTFADGQKPQVLSGINEAQMPYKKYFKFNNSALYAGDENSDDCDSDFDAMFWNMGEKSFNVFLKELDTTVSKSLSLTRDVLHERNQLQVSISGIQVDIKLGLNKLEQLKKEVEILITHQADIDRNRNFTYTVTEDKFEKVSIPAGRHITNCLQCNRTCHEICGIPQDRDKYGCWAMTNGYCRICPSKCYWDLHSNFPYKFVSKQVQVVKTAEDLRKRYQEAKQKKLSAEGLVQKVEEEFNAVQLKVLGLTETVRKSLERLKDIALKPNPLSTVGYIEILIEAEKVQADPGWQSRVAQLQRVRGEAEYMQKVADRGFDPFIDYKKKIELERKENKKGMWSQVGEYLGNIFK